MTPRKCELCQRKIPGKTQCNRRFCDWSCEKIAWDAKHLKRKPRLSARGRPRMTIEERLVALKQRRKAGIPAPSKKKLDWGTPQEFTELNLCYFMGLLVAILDTDEVHRARGTWQLEKVTEKVRENGVLIGFNEKYTGKVLPDLNSDKLADCAHKLGDQFYEQWHNDHKKPHPDCLLCPQRQQKAVKKLRKAA